jgi:hypothetical protein
MGIAHSNVAIANTPRDAAAGVRSKVVDWFELCADLAGRSNNRHPDGVFRMLLH